MYIAWLLIACAVLASADLSHEGWGSARVISRRDGAIVVRMQTAPSVCFRITGSLPDRFQVGASFAARLGDGKADQFDNEAVAAARIPCPLPKLSAGNDAPMYAYPYPRLWPQLWVNTYRPLLPFFPEYADTIDKFDEMQDLTTFFTREFTAALAQPADDWWSSRPDFKSVIQLLDSCEADVSADCLRARLALDTSDFSTLLSLARHEPVQVTHDYTYDPQTKTIQMGFKTVFLGPNGVGATWQGDELVGPIVDSIKVWYELYDDPADRKLIAPATAHFLEDTKNLPTTWQKVHAFGYKVPHKVALKSSAPMAPTQFRQLGSGARLLPSLLSWGMVLLTGALAVL